MSLTYVVTGAGRGIGAEFVRQLSSKGHTVIACARNLDTSDELSSMVDGKTVHAVELDIVDTDSVKAAADRIAQIAPNGIDVLINNAGIAGDRDLTILNVDAKLLMDHLTVNVVGAANVSKALLPALRKKDVRQIINISSALGSIGETQKDTTEGPVKFAFGAYRVSKAALNMVTKELAVELEHEGFVVVSVCPGWVKTRLGTDHAVLTTKDSIAGMLSAFEKRLGNKKEANGSFFNSSDQDLPW